jgi:hypothetical protein
MTNKEWLEKVKKVHLERIKQNEFYTASFLHVERLIEQAEKIERYEEALKDIMELSMRGSMNEFAYGQLAKQALEKK